MALYGSDANPKTELLVNGVWTDFSSRPRAEQKIVITRGRASEQSRVTAQSCSTSLNNRDGVLSNRNPNSPNYGLLPRNTQFRVRAGTGDTYAKLLYTDVVQSGLAYVFTTDKAVLDVTGDIDVRAEIQPYSWRPQANMNVMLKYGTASNQRSWMLYILQSGQLTFLWSSDGTAAGRIFATSTVSIPANSGRLAIRATLDVNNGASGNTVVFYTSSSISGTWTQLGSAIVTAGVTSIFNSTAALTIGGGADNQSSINGNTGFGGKAFKAEVWNGIGGTRVANMDATAQAIDTGSWSDGLATPNTWTTFGTGTRITSDRTRFTGELSSLPQVWDKTGTDIYVPVTASGLIRRLTQGSNPISSAMTRNFKQYTQSEHWPLEDQAGATQAATSSANGKPAQTTAVTFGADNTGLPGTASVAQFQDSTSLIQFSCSKLPTTGTISCVFYVNLSALPATSKVLMTFYTTGTVRAARIALGAGLWTTTLLAGDGSTLATSNVAVAGIDPSAGWVGYNLLLQTSGSNVTYSIRWDAISTFGGGVGPTTISSAVLGSPNGGYTNAIADAAFQNAKIAQIFMSTNNLDLTDDTFRKASSAWLGETAGARLIRLSREQNQPIEITGLTAATEPMGYQTVDTWVNLVYDCTDTDGGILAECRDKLALSYRTRTALESRSDVTIDYAQSILSDVPLPTEDDAGFTNDVTASRPGGSSARVQNIDGPTSVSDPPAGVGQYATSIQRNIATDSRLDDVAGWAVLTGSWDDARYPSMQVGMHRDEVQSSATLTGQLTALEIGDTAVLHNLPAWLPPDDVPELIQGYTETLDKFTWTINYNATPAGPYVNAPIAGSDTLPVRADATTHTIGGSLTTTATSVTFVTLAGSARWVNSANYPAEFPFDVKIDGEVITVTAISGTSSPQTATLTRSVNGVVKTHSSGALVRLARPAYFGR